MNNHKKFGFTLAEIIVALTVVGIIAVIAVPQLTSGVDDAKYKASYKKAYTNVARVVAIQKSEGKLPKAGSTAEMINLFKALDKNLQIQGYADRKGDGNVLTKGSIYRGLSWKDNTFGDASNTLTSAMTSNYMSPWIITKDGMAFTITYPTSGACKKRSEINDPTTTAANALNKSCLFIVVDVNGLYEGPNLAETQVKSGIASNAKLKKLTGDRLYIYIASDGIAKGSELLTVTGRILSDD